MKYVSTLARAVAAVAVAGAAITGTAVAAGAATTPLSGDATGNPTVTFGPGATRAAPGAEATVPLHGDAQGSAESPASSPVSQVPLKSGDQVATASAPADACVGAALLSGHGPDGCSGQGAGSSSPSSSLTDVLGSDAVRNAPGAGALCAAVAALGLTGVPPCDASGAGSGNGNGSDADRRLGGASAGGPTALDAGRKRGATSASAAASGNASAGGAGASGQTSATAGPSSARFNAACASQSRGLLGGSAPRTNGTAGVLGGALAAAGLAIRRIRRPRLA